MQGEMDGWEGQWWLTCSQTAPELGTYDSMTAPILAVPANSAATAARAAFLPLAALAPLVVGALTAPAQAGPVLCTTTLEAPMDAEMGSAPVEVTRCGVTSSPVEVMQRRYYSYSAPYASGINILHQLTDALGLALSGPGGNKLVGVGFPDQAIVWDGSAIENTYGVMLNDQNGLMPVRTSDISNGFGASLVPGPEPAYVQQPASTTWTPPVRGLW